MTDEQDNAAVPNKTGKKNKDTADKGERIAKRLARAGVCSRRDAERWIAEGRVIVNGSKLDTPAFLVAPDDLIVVDGKPLPETERTRVWRYHKPAGVMTTHKDPEGRPTVFERLPEDMPRVISVGRLDYASEGLLLLTNDGEFARRLELPSNSWVRRYRVRVHGEVEPEKLVVLENGITVDGVRYGSIKAVLDRQKGANAWVTVSIKEGKNREVRRVFEYLGWPVLRLIRVAYGPFQLGSLAEGEAEEVPAKVFKEQLGQEDSKWAKAAPDSKPHLPHAPGTRKGGRTRVEGGKDHPFADERGNKDGKSRRDDRPKTGPKTAPKGGPKDGPKGSRPRQDDKPEAGRHADRRRKP